MGSLAHRSGLANRTARVAGLRRVLCAACATCAAAALPAGVSAATYTWNGSTGNFTDSSKWSPSVVPGSADIAAISYNVSSQMNFTSSRTVPELLSDGGATVITLNGHTLTANRFHVTGRNSGSATNIVEIISGRVQTTVNADYFVGYLTGNNGRLRLRNAFFTGPHGQFWVGHNGRGELEVFEGSTFDWGGRVLINTSTGSRIYIDGGSVFQVRELAYAASSSGNIIGSWGTGTFKVYGDDLTVGSSGEMGFRTLTSGQHLKVTGSSNTLYVQSGGSLTAGGGSIEATRIAVTGTLGISAGGTVTVGTLDLGGNPSRLNFTGGTLNLTGPGTNNISSGDWFIQGTGSPTVNHSGGSVSVPSGLYLGSSAGTSGTYSLTGGTLRLTSIFGSTYIGLGGSGILSIVNTGSLLECSNNLYVGHNGTGTLNVLSGGTLAPGHENFDIWVGLGTSGNGTMVVNAGGTVQLPNVSHAYLVAGQGGGTGQVQQTGGWVSTYFLQLGTSSTTSAGTYNLSGGSVSANGAYMGGDEFSSGGTGTLNISGGTFTTTGTTKVWNNNSKINLSGGTLTTGTLDLGGTPSRLNFTGGTLNLTGPGTNNISSASWTVEGTGSATVNHSGGSVSLPSTLSLGNSAGTSGIYSLSGTGALSSSVQHVGLSGTGTFTQTGGTNTISNSLHLGFNSTGFGTYNLSGGTISASAAYVGGDITTSGGTGTLNISGGTFTNTGTTKVWNNASKINLSGGTLTTGTLDLGGVASRLNFNGGTLNLTGPGSHNISSGSWSVEGTGSPTVNHSGGGVSVPSSLYLGNNSGTSGTYNLSGTGALSPSVQIVGVSGTGTLAQTGGTNTISNSLHLGFNSTGRGTYSLSGTGALSALYQYVGVSGTGTLAQTGGTNTIGNSLYLGVNDTGNGTYNLSGGTASTAEAYVGSFNTSGTGTLNISGGTFTAPVLTSVLNNNSKINLSGGTLKTGTLNLQGIASRLNFTGGTLWLTSNTFHGPGALTVPNTGLLKGVGTLPAVSLNTAGTLQSAGGTLTVTGAVGGGGTAQALAGSTLELAGGNGPWGAVALLEVEGTARIGAPFSAVTADVGAGGLLVIDDATLTLDALLLDAAGRIDLIGGELVVNNGDLAALTASIASGRNGGAWDGFGIGSSTAAADPSQYAVVASQQGSAVRVMLTMAGDLDLDGVVSVTELGILATNWGRSGATLQEGDFNMDGVVDVSDLGILATNWGRSIGSPMSLQEAVMAFPILADVAVPEPSSLMLLGAAAAGLLRRRQR